MLDTYGEGPTRLVIRARVRGEPRWALTVLSPLLGVGDYLNASAMLRGIKRRSERTGQLAADHRVSRRPELGRGPG